MKKSWQIIRRAQLFFVPLHRENQARFLQPLGATKFSLRGNKKSPLSASLGRGAGKTSVRVERCIGRRGESVYKKTTTSLAINSLCEWRKAKDERQKIPLTFDPYGVALKKCKNEKMKKTL